MKPNGQEERNRLRQLDRKLLESHQLQRLNTLLSVILPRNEFYRERLGDIQLPLTSLDQIAEFPVTQKDDLISAGDEFARNRTFDIADYSRFHRTSGTQGKPMIVLDTADDWNWWIETWQFVLDAAEITSDDRVAMAFSFGPFIGFWSANDALAARGALVVPCGGMDTLSRLQTILAINATAICCTPTYALRMAEVATENEINLKQSNVSRIIVAGEPGGSIPEFRSRIELVWGADVIDHTGATEIGPWGFADSTRSGIHIIESEFLAEFHSVATGLPSKEGELSELFLTTLGRTGSPVIRYKTGDRVRPFWNRTDLNCNFVFLKSGVLGRADDMMIIRGVNVFPSSIEKILRGFSELIEFRMTAMKHGEMDTVRIEVETRDDINARIAQELRSRLGLSIDVVQVPMNSLPRFEAKGKRFIDKR